MSQFKHNTKQKIKKTQTVYSLADKHSSILHDYQESLKLITSYKKILKNSRSPKNT